MTYNIKSYRLILDACEKALIEKTLSIIVGESGVGKTIALNDFLRSRSDVISLYRPIRSKSVGDNDQLVIVDNFGSLDNRSLTSLKSMIRKCTNCGFVISVDLESFNKMRHQIFGLLEERRQQERALRYQFGLVQDDRAYVKISGSQSIKRDEEFSRKFIVINGNRSESVNSIYFLRRPTITDVEAICKEHGVNSGVHELYQQGTTITKLMKAIKRKQSERNVIKNQKITFMNKEQINPGQLKKLHTLLHKLGMMDSKMELVIHFSNGRVTSSKDLSKRECARLLEHLERADPGAVDPRSKMIRKIYAIAYELGIIVPGDETERKINNAALDSWLVRNSFLHKSLHDYSQKELPKLVSQLEQIEKHIAEAKAGKAASEAVVNLLVELDLKTSRK